MKGKGFYLAKMSGNESRKRTATTDHRRFENHISFVTNALIIVGGVELNAPSLKVLIERTNKLKDAAEVLLELFGRPKSEGVLNLSFESIAESMTAGYQ